MTKTGPPSGGPRKENMKEFKIKMSETMRNAIYSVINPDNKEECFNTLCQVFDEFKNAYHGDKLHARLAFNSCLVNVLADILSE